MSCERCKTSRAKQSALRPFEYGELFESFLINEFFKLRSALNLRWNYSYLRTPDDVEIDLIIEKPRGKPVP